MAVKALKWISVAIGVGLALATVVSVKACVDLNHELNRCAVEASPEYIWDEKVRAKACEIL